MVSVLDLPAELVIEIASYLDTKELGLLRRSCKHVEQVLFETFATEFFTKRQFMIEHTSLQALVDISNHPTLSGRLVEVIISTHMLGDLKISDPQHRHVIPREWLLRTGQARDMLVEAFSKLKNLKIVGLRDFNASGRMREGGPDAVWRSYGWSAGRSSNPYLTTASMESDPNPGTLFSLILWALGTARAQPTDLQVILRKHATLGPHAFKVNAVNAPVISKLKTVFLNMHSDNTNTVMDEEPLKIFLSNSNALEMLRLNFDSRWSAPSRLLGWLNTSPSATDSYSSLDKTPSAPLFNLTTLEIGMTTIAGPSLALALSRFKLKSFSLWRITLSDEKRDPVPTDRWARFLKSLSEALEGSDSVERVLIGLMAQVSQHAPRMASWEKVQICPEGTTDKAAIKEDDLQKEAKFRGRYGLSASQWLGALAEHTYVRSIHAPLLDSDSEGEEDYESEDDGFDAAANSEDDGSTDDEDE